METVTDTSVETVITTSESEGTHVDVRNIDKSLEAPVFDLDPAGETSVMLNGTVVLEASASVTDGGTVTYQWYSNSTNGNGGGTRIEGATGSNLQVPTDKGGTTFYYVVAINDHGDRINETTSACHAVSVWDNMYWQQSAENGGFQYLSRENGNYPANISMEIDGVWYWFNENGFAIDQDGNLININTGEVATVDDVKEEKEEEASSEEKTEKKSNKKSNKKKKTEEVKSSSDEG